MSKIFIVEDEKTIRDELSIFLSRYGYQIEAPDNFENVIENIKESKADLILLDINLPIFDGYYICREVRKFSEIPIIVVTSRDSDIDELMSMNLGADDFVTKPYNTQILLARIESILKRVNRNSTQVDILEYKDMKVNLSNGTISYNDKTIEITKNELKILSYLIKNNIQEIKIVTDKMMELDKETRLKVNSNDEVGELKQQINDLYSTLLRTIDDLEFKNKEILKLEKLKYDFFKGASHELKTPLASLKIILENMKYNIGKYKERDIYINECIEIVDSLTKNICQILSVHSIENLNNDEEYLKINDTLEDILKKYEILANQKKITVNNYILDENIYIGKTALKIILSNLISNAVKYTDVNGVINIGIVNDWLYIENTYGNNKISNMDKIFDVKFDLNKENSNGLGLYIVSNILNNYNMEYKALQDEEIFIFKIKIFS